MCVSVHAFCVHEIGSGRGSDHFVAKNTAAREIRDPERLSYTYVRARICLGGTTCCTKRGMLEKFSHTHEILNCHFLSVLRASRALAHHVRMGF